ncbi:MAG: type IIL restriction-modification enzyme MmeI, partial [Nanoarchaeota archaeon]
MDKELAKQEVSKLVKEFSEYSAEELNKKSENQIKSEFFDPLFEALGWNMRKEAEREEKILRGRADYILKLQNQEILVIEAKKTNVSLSEDEGRQAVSYAYHRKIKFSILTNFKYIRVYHALSNIKNIDKNLLFWLEFKDFEKEFEKLWLVSKESFEKQEINKILSKKEEKQFMPVDESILTDLLEIRRILSNDLKKLRMYLTDEKIDEAIQILIDRLIFIRSVEDRGLENQNFLLGLVKDSREGRLKKKLWYVLQDYFMEFDSNYNSKLFSSGILEDEKNIFVDDETLEKVIKILYFGVKDRQARYMFDEIPGDLLGSIYEQYLGVVLRGTEKRVRLDSES